MNFSVTVLAVCKRLTPVFPFFFLLLSIHTRHCPMVVLHQYPVCLPLILSFTLLCKTINCACTCYMFAMLVMHWKRDREIVRALAAAELLME
ncbi:MAG: hypothetical protein BYD32DRAFT_426979 [Podila humilis]|nr:MAG: hypothetical protein BYD32DRAFT_426979 [Podila humilis]